MAKLVHSQFFANGCSANDHFGVCVLASAVQFVPKTELESCRDPDFDFFFFFFSWSTGPSHS